MIYSDAYNTLHLIYNHPKFRRMSYDKYDYDAD